jgi:hypothetical protein
MEESDDLGWKPTVPPMTPEIAAALEQQLQTPIGKIDLAQALAKYELTPEEVRFAKRHHKGDGPNTYLEGGPPNAWSPEMQTPIARAKWRKNMIRSLMKRERERERDTKIIH